MSSKKQPLCVRVSPEALAILDSLSEGLPHSKGYHVEHGLRILASKSLEIQKEFAIRQLLKVSV